MTSEKRLKLINENMDLFGPLPNDYEKFVEQSVFKLENIIIYSTKENKAYCTGCKQRTNDLKIFKTQVKHNKKVTCPCCGRYSVAKSKGHIKNGFEVIRWSMIVEKSGENVLIRYINHLRKYKSDGSYTQTTTEMLRTVITAIGRRDFGLYYDGWAFWRKPCGYFERSEHYEPRQNVMLYNTDIDKDLRDTICKYSAVGIIVKNNEMKVQEDCVFADKHIRQDNPYIIERYLTSYVKYPYIEQLTKLGLSNLLYVAIEMYYDHYGIDIFVQGKKRIHETLGLTRSEYLQLMSTKHNPSCNDIVVIKKLRKANLRVTDETFIALTSNANQIHTSDFIAVRKYLSEIKSINMLKMHGTKYADYLDMADRLKWNMKSTMVLFPRDFKQAHEIAVEQFNKQKQKNIRAYLKKVSQSHVYDFGYKDLMILVPKSGTQIVKEGQVLHHCGARYVDEVGNQNTMILFVRRKDNPDKQFYTLEWKDGVVKQCYGFKDCDMTDEVKEFVKEFEIEMNNREIQKVS